MRFWISFASLIFILVAPLHANPKTLEGNWKVSFFQRGQELSFWMVKLKAQGEKLTGTVDPKKGVPPSSIEDMGLNKQLLTFSIDVRGQKFNFEFLVPEKKASELKGSIARGSLVLPALMTATQAKSLADTFTLSKEELERNPDSPKAFASVLKMVEGAAENNVSAKELEGLVEIATKNAGRFGPRWQSQFNKSLINSLVNEKKYATIALETVRTLVKDLDPSASAEQKLDAYSLLATALKNSGQVEEFAKLDKKLDKLEQEAYEEHRKHGFDFQVKPYKRAFKKDSRVLVELFTGAQCPPCVAADVAFDALGKSYSSKDVVLLQYHLHIPGPDPLTNETAEDRQEYYGDEVRGTPSIFFNGMAKAGGGGPKSAAGRKFAQYKQVINPMLREDAPATIKAQAKKDGSKVNINVQVSDLKKMGEKVRLRIALVEDWARYAGRNGLTFHHHVVRDFPGGVEGFPLKDKSFKKSLSVNLEQLRKEISKYLDDFAAINGSFINGQPRLRLKDLRVVAFVQDDESKEVLQAVEVPVK